MVDECEIVDAGLVKKMLKKCFLMKKFLRSPRDSPPSSLRLSSIPGRRIAVGVFNKDLPLPLRWCLGCLDTETGTHGNYATTFLLRSSSSGSRARPGLFLVLSRAHAEEETGLRAPEIGGGWNANERSAGFPGFHLKAPWLNDSRLAWHYVFSRP